MSSAELSTQAVAVGVPSHPHPSPQQDYITRAAAAATAASDCRGTTHGHSHGHSFSSFQQSAHAHAPAHVPAHSPTHHSGGSFQQQQCRGSLPLKKRRYHDIITYHAPQHHQQQHHDIGNGIVSTGTSASTSTSISSHQHQHSVDVVANMGLGQLVPNSYSTADEKFAALALVAAATATVSGVGGTNGLGAVGGGCINPTPAVDPFSLSSVAAAAAAAAVSSQAALSLGYNHHHNATINLNSSDENGNKHGSTSATKGNILLNNSDNANINANIKVNIKEKDSTSKKGGNTGNGGAKSTLKTTQQRQRVNHPPLSAPIPGGCHGRTSRNNSYCRRTPCYNGSNYCKLHYQQYVVNGDNSANGNNNSNSNTNSSSNHNSNSTKGGRLRVEEKGGKNQQNSLCVSVGNEKSAENTAGQNGNGNSNGNSNSVSSSGRHHQDKRYTGLSADEVQCLATTTRGRPCAYVSVSGTKYCHLHADYDTNPPPRRGGGQKSKSSSLAMSTSQNSRVVGAPNSNMQSLMAMAQIASLQISNHSLTLPIEAVPVSSLNGTGTGTSTLQSGTGMSAQNHQQQQLSEESRKVQSKAKLSDKLKEKTSTMIHPQYPLLNSIPSDKWSNKQVLIGTGPLVNHVGRVIKWGNGWVTVSTTTSGNCSSAANGAGGVDNNEILHNRRAIELYLLPDDTSPLSILPTTSENVTTAAPAIISTSSYENPKPTVQSDSLNTNAKSMDIPLISEAVSKGPTCCVVKNNCDVVPKADKKDNVMSEKLEESQSIHVVKFESVKQVDTTAKGGCEKESSDARNNSSEGKHDVMKEGESNDTLSGANNTSHSASVNTVKDPNNHKLMSEPTSEKERQNNKTMPVPEVSESTILEGGVSKNIPLTTLKSENCVEEDYNLIPPDIPSESQPTQTHDSQSPTTEKKLTLMEELILAQTGRMVKNVDLALCSGGGRTIHKPERYEDKTLIKKKRNRFHNDGEHDEEGSPLKRKKMTNSPGVNSPKSSCGKSPGTVGRILNNINKLDSAQDDSHSLVTDSQEDHRIEKIKA